MTTATVIAYVAAGCAGTLAIVAASLARRHFARWAFVLGMAAAAVESAVTAASFRSGAAPDFQAWQTIRLILTCGVIGCWWVFSRVYARGDTAHSLARNALLLGAVLTAPWLLWFGREHLIVFVAYSKTTSAWILRLGWIGYLLHLAFLVGAIAVVMNLERTFRAAVGTTRWRIKFALIGVGVLFVTRLYTSSEVLLFRGLDLRLETLNCGALIVASPLIAWSFIRTRGLELDVYPSGPALRNSLTVLLTGVYLVVVGLLAKVVAFLGGDAAFSLKAFVVLLAMVALALALQSDRARLRLRVFVSRNFHRPLHDYPEVWKRVTDATASHVEQEALCRSQVVLLADVFQALSVRIWTTNEKKDVLALTASTTAAAARAGDDAVPAEEIAAHFAGSPAPVDLDAATPAWGAQLRDRHPCDFPNGGHRFCMPLLARGEFLGVITLGDRVGGAPMTEEDIELLKCIANHAAAGLLNIQLSQRLLEAKQLEAFQAMAAFFVHDLKNAASTLGLTLRNLPVHFDDPEFRADALRGIGKTVDHINRLVGRLTALRHELKINPSVADINELVAQVLNSFEHATPPVITDIHPVPRVPFDREQLQKVITNLVLNATEAVGTDGRVRVSTGQQNGWVVVTVDDNGCGMSKDFLAHSLFHPFQTTKKSGLGIGMFQSKMIVEAHGGRIAVASQPGNGTRFQVFLRATAVAG